MAKNRLVYYKRYIPSEFAGTIQINGTGVYENDFNGRGYFLGWGLTSVQDPQDSSTVLATIALVEVAQPCEDGKAGTVIQLDTWNIKFMN